MNHCQFCEIAYYNGRCPCCEATEALNCALKERDELREKLDSLEADHNQEFHTALAALRRRA
jgi:hypothetical protein